MTNTDYVPTLPKTLIGLLRRFTTEQVHVYVNGNAKPGNGVSASALLRLQREDMVKLLIYRNNPERGKLIQVTEAGHRVLGAHAERQPVQLAAVAAAR